MKIIIQCAQCGSSKFVILQVFWEDSIHCSSHIQNKRLIHICMYAQCVLHTHVQFQKKAQVPVITLSNELVFNCQMNLEYVQSCGIFRFIGQLRTYFFRFIGHCDHIPQFHNCAHIPRRKEGLVTVSTPTQWRPEWSASCIHCQGPPLLDMVYVTPCISMTDIMNNIFSTTLSLATITMPTIYI